MPSKRKKWGTKTEKRGEERKLKVKVKCHEILFSAHVWTLPANILHLDQKAAKCMAGLFHGWWVAGSRWRVMGGGWWVAGGGWRVAGDGWWVKLTFTNCQANKNKKWKSLKKRKSRRHRRQSLAVCYKHGWIAWLLLDLSFVMTYKYVWQTCQQSLKIISIEHFFWIV